jgi:hypothetical protein
MQQDIAEQQNSCIGLDLFQKAVGGRLAAQPPLLT